MSIPLDFGYWRMKDGRRRLLTFWPDCGAVTLDGPGGLDILARCDDEDEIRRRLTDWAEHCDTPDGLAWLANQLEGCR
jgi:hypothetical protein